MLDARLDAAVATLLLRLPISPTLPARPRALPAAVEEGGAGTGAGAGDAPMLFVDERERFGGAARLPALLLRLSIFDTTLMG